MSKPIYLLAVLKMLALLLFSSDVAAQKLKILDENAPYLPDFSYAGFFHGEKPLELNNAKIFEAIKYGVTPDDGLDDSAALIKLIANASKHNGPVVIQLPKGRIILSSIIYIERSHLVLKGYGSSATELYFPRPLNKVPDPDDLKELREYLVLNNKIQKQKKDNIYLPYSQYAWTGGFIWTRVPGTRVKSYLPKYDQPVDILAVALQGKRGTNIIHVNDTKNLKKGDVIQVNWYNKSGEDGSIISVLYPNKDIFVGSHHWTNPDQPLVSQEVEVLKVSKNKITIKDTLMLDIGKKEIYTDIVKWEHLTHVGMENFKITFPKAAYVAHHVEEGYNAIFLTRLFNGWVQNVEIENADSGILLEEVANITVENITTSGDNLAHYTVAMGNTHNVLVRNLRVMNHAIHPLSFNTYSTRNVYTQSYVDVFPVLDQHSGANHQNLFDNIHVKITPTQKQIQSHSYPLFKGGGAKYWKPTHGAYSTFWNIHVQLTSAFSKDKDFILNGVDDGPQARLIGVHGNQQYKIEYGPDAYIEALNTRLSSVPSLYEYQLEKRLKESKK